MNNCKIKDLFYEINRLQERFRWINNDQIVVALIENIGEAYKKGVK